MQAIEPTNNEHRWPRRRVKSVAARKTDFIIRITDWTKDEDEPAYDVEVYIGGVYDWNESKSFSLATGLSKEQAKAKAIEFAHSQTIKLL